MSRCMMRCPAAVQLLDISDPSLCVLGVTGDELVMTGLSRKIFSNALKTCHKRCTCLCGALFTLLDRQTGYFERFKNFPLADKWWVLFMCVHTSCSSAVLYFSQLSSTCAAVVTSSPHQASLSYSGQISRWGWADGERERAGRMICLASCRVTQSHHNHREFSECVLLLYRFHMFQWREIWI